MSESNTRISNTPFFCISSGKGGVGKTSITVNLGAILARKGQRVLLIDGDLGLANVDILLNLEVGSTIADVINRGDDPTAAIIEVEPNFHVLPASSGVTEMATLCSDEQEKLANILEDMGAQFDLVLVDTAAGIGPVVRWFNTIAAHNIVIVTPEPTSITDAYALIKVLYMELERSPFHLVINSTQNEQKGQAIFKGMSEVADRFLGVRLNLLGTLPRDEQVIQALREKSLAIEKFPDGAVSIALKGVAEKVIELALMPKMTPA